MTRKALALCGCDGTRLALCVVLLGAFGCNPSPKVTVRGTVRDPESGAPIAGARILVDDKAAASRTGADGSFHVEVAQGRHALRAQAPHRCGSREEVTVGAKNKPLVLHAAAALSVRGPTNQVGFGTDVALEAVARCGDIESIAWKQVSGPSLHLTVDATRSERLVIRTHALSELTQLTDAVGIVPFSRKERGDYRFEVRVTFRDREPEQTTVRVTSSATATGTYQVPTGADLYLNGGANATHAWTLVQSPRGSKAMLADAATRTPHFRPDRFGEYVVRHDPSGTVLDIQAGAYEDVPHDCGRVGCHQAEDRGWESTAHAATFRRGVTGELGAGFNRTCWACHATGVDPGVQNGGLLETAHRTGWNPAQPNESAWENAPRQIRRHGSVWCSACHGPGRILPPEYKWEYQAKFGVAVCARCHDAQEDPDSPHESWQVAEWRNALMSKFTRGLTDSDPALREGCASCHSAQGFVEWTRRGAHMAPNRSTVAAITCATCHDAHGNGGPHGVRLFNAPLNVAGMAAPPMGTGTICANCHRAEPDSQFLSSWADAPSLRAPHAPQTDVLLGRAAHAIRRNEENAHANLPNACVACHMTAPATSADRTHTGGHTFSVRDLSTNEPRWNPTACASCHQGQTPDHIGERDWNGDGRVTPIREEFTSALETAKQKLQTRISALAVRDDCEAPATASHFIDHDGELVLASATNALLGDCNRNGSFDGEEHAASTRRVPRVLLNAAYNLQLVTKDGSYGVHNPNYTFRILRELTH